MNTTCRRLGLSEEQRESERQRVRRQSFTDEQREENVREQEITGKEPAKKIVRKNEQGIEKGGQTGVNSDGKRRERGIERDEIAVNNVAWQNVSEPETTDKVDEKENYKRKDYDSKTTCQQKVSERLITEFRKWEEQNVF